MWQPDAASRVRLEVDDFVFLRPWRKREIHAFILPVRQQHLDDASVEFIEFEAVWRRTEM